MGCPQSKNQINSDEVCIINHPDAHPESRANSASSGKRQVSANSKNSTDSGYADEDSNKHHIGLFNKNTRALPDRKTEKNILEELQKEGFIGQNLNSKPLAISFEILTETDKEFANALRRPPPRLAKIEEQRKKRPPLTEEQIREKLRKVEERRQKLREKKALKNSEMLRTNSMDLPKISDESEAKSKAEIVAENRAQRLQEKLDKLERRKKHSEQVRQRKVLSLQNVTENVYDNVIKVGDSTNEIN